MQGASGGDVSLGSSQRSSLGILPVDKMTGSDDFHQL